MMNLVTSPKTLRIFLSSSLKVQLLLICLIFWQSSRAQIVESFHSEWDDRFSEWNIAIFDEEEQGSLSLKWRLRNDWTSWNFELLERTGQIQLKWSDDPNLWELICDGKLVTARTKRRNDFSEWRLSDGEQQLTFWSRFRNDISEWEIRDPERFGDYRIFMEWESDPRDWIVLDDTNDELSVEMRFLCAFLAIYHSIPKG